MRGGHVSVRRILCQIKWGNELRARGVLHTQPALATPRSGRREESLTTVRRLLGLCTLALVVCWQAPASADAANSPTFRDCSLVGGVDPDFVQLTGVAVGPGGSLIVSRGRTQVGIEASESSDPGDNMGHVTLNVKVSSPKQPTVERSGAGTGKVVLSIPLENSKTGRRYTISWADTTDNGSHVCPSSNTPQNTTPMPFVVTVQKAKNYTYCAYSATGSECFPGPFEVFRKSHVWNWNEVGGEVSGTFTVSGKQYVFRETSPESRDELRGTKGAQGVISGKLYENGAPGEFTFTLTPR
jgi:hypothetical protein